MSDSEARDQIEGIVEAHASDLDPDDLRDIAGSLEEIAARWEEVSL